MSLEDVTLILVGVANSMRKKKYVSSLLRCYILENWYFDELRGLFIILKIKIIVCQWTMLWQLKCIWCGIFFTGTSLPFVIRLTIVKQNGSNVNATAQASVSSKWIKCIWCLLFPTLSKYFMGWIHLISAKYTTIKNLGLMTFVISHFILYHWAV